MSKVLGLPVHKFKLRESARQFASGAASLGHAMQCRTQGAKIAVHVYFVFKTDLEAFADHRSFDVYEIAVAGGLLELDVQFQDRRSETFGFHIGVACTCGAEVFGAGLFEPYGVNGVVDNSHLVGFRVADFNTCGVLVGANFHAQNI